VSEVARWADAAVVGSALVSVVAEHGASPTLVPAVESYIRWLRGDGAGAQTGSREALR